jgi:hypothetical protein
MKKINLIIALAIILSSITFVSAGTTTLSRDMHLSIGDCWNDEKITSINGLTFTWEKGCNKTEILLPENETNITNNTTEETNITEPLPPLIDHYCNLVKGDGIHNIIVTGNEFYNETFMIDFGNWVYETLNQEAPYNEFSWELYYENKEGDCNFGNYSDFRITIGTINYKGLSWFDGSSINRVWFSKDLPAEGREFKWTFLLKHELGHIFTKSGHTNDGSIMDVNGGDAKYRDYQLEIIRSNLQ